MDLSFHVGQAQGRGPGPLKGTEVSGLSLLLAAAAARQAVSATARFVALSTDNAVPQEDSILALVRLFAPRGSVQRGGAVLAGSFNPLVAGLLGVRSDSVGNV